MKRLCKICSSELYSNNKVVAHNTFAIPVLTPTFRIIKWTREELEQMDVKTRKILSCNGSFHVNSDIDRLYTRRDKGRRGLNSIVDVYIARIISISRHLIGKSLTNKYLNLVLNHEQPTSIRPVNELLETFNICSNSTHSKKIMLNIKNLIKSNHHECWLKKSEHGYLFRSYDNIQNKNEKLNNELLKKGNLSSHVEGYICTIQEEEINACYLKLKRNNNIKPVCRLCKQQNKTIQHVVASCPSISSSMYLPFHHDKVAYVIYKQMLTNKRDEKVYVQEFYKDDSIEVWWDTRIKTLQKIQHNRPDILVWKIKEKLCFIIDVSIGLDVNVYKNYELKHSSYLPLAAELKCLYEV